MVQKRVVLSVFLPEMTSQRTGAKIRKLFLQMNHYGNVQKQERETTMDIRKLRYGDLSCDNVKEVGIDAQQRLDTMLRSGIGHVI